MAKKDEKEEEKKEEEQKAQGNEIEKIYKRLNDIYVTLSSIKDELALLEKVRDEVINTYAKVDRLESELEKLRKMLYWHRQATEKRKSQSQKTYSSKKSYNKGGSK